MKKFLDQIKSLSNEDLLKEKHLLKWPLYDTTPLENKDKEYSKTNSKKTEMFKLIDDEIKKRGLK
ncbi:hypothetical protein HQ584_07560 [Patescibacteria group bacterium]|nr:hypothetical protein [Patescibacteria group bacterium]